jgi:hypothetical protein
MFGCPEVIFDKGLYDKDTVVSGTVGFRALHNRVHELPLDRVTKLTGCDANMIPEAGKGSYLGHIIKNPNDKAANIEAII